MKRAPIDFPRPTPSASGSGSARKLVPLLAGISLGLSACAGSLTFRPSADGGFEFDTGELRGRLRRGGQSVGLQEVVHAPTGLRLDHSMGLLSHYRVFTLGRRYGGGAWDWKSDASIQPDGSAEITWRPLPDRPFELQAHYRWLDPHTIELITRVTAKAPLRGFESFVASYFSETFTEAGVWKATLGNGVAVAPQWIPASRDRGEWQMFPRDNKAATLIRDGRWKLEPNPVDWVLRDPLDATFRAERRSAARGVTLRLESDETHCFAVAMPYQEESHRSLYFSLFGTDLQPGQVLQNRLRLSLSVAHAVGDTVRTP